MKMRAAAIAATCFVGSSAYAGIIQVGVNDSSAPLHGWMNVFELPANGGGLAFGSAWGIADLTATFDDVAGTMTMSPNTIADPDPFWYIGGGGPGAQGNKIMEANLYQQIDDGSFAGSTVTFDGFVSSDTLTGAHSAKVFIRDFASDFSSVVESSVAIVDGAFSISLDTIADPTRHVQWGIQVSGVDVWITDVAPFGSLAITTVPSPSALALLSFGGIAASRRRR